MKDHGCRHQMVPTANGRHKKLTNFNDAVQIETRSIEKSSFQNKLLTRVVRSISYWYFTVNYTNRLVLDPSAIQLLHYICTYDARSGLKPW